MVACNSIGYFTLSVGEPQKKQSSLYSDNVTGGRDGITEIKT
jgi:hypothetical protein